MYQQYEYDPPFSYRLTKKIKTHPQFGRYKSVCTADWIYKWKCPIVSVQIPNVSRNQFHTLMILSDFCHT